MQWPDAGIVSIKSDGHSRTWRNHERITQGTGYLFAVDFYNLEIVTMQMHRVSHVGRDTEGNSDAFVVPDIERLTIGIGSAVDRPNIGRHVSAKRRLQHAIDGVVGKGIQSPKPLFLSVVERCSRDSSCTRELRNRCSLCDQDDSAQQFRPFTLCDNRISAALFWDCYLEVKALRHAELEKIALNRLHRFPINREDLSFQGTCVDIKILIGGRS